MAFDSDSIEIPVGADVTSAYRQLRELAGQLETIIKRGGQAGEAIESALARAGKQGQILKQTLNQLSRGSPEAAIVNASGRGRAADLAASPLGLDAAKIRASEKFYKDIQSSIDISYKRQRALTAETENTTRSMRVQEVLSVRRARLSEAIRHSEGQITEEFLKAKQAYQKTLDLSERIRESEKRRTQELRNQTREINADQTRQRRSETLPGDADQARQRRNEVLFGDGGQSLFLLQARLLAHYQLISTVYNSIRFGAQFVAQFDEALYDLQAVAQLTRGEMEGLSKAIIDVSETTKFTAVEVAQAAKTLSQAGFSKEEIEQSIEGVTLLATATGSTLNEAVDVATSAIAVFNLRAGEMGEVADIITSSLNLTKLTMNKLALGLQYTGNIAAQAQIPFSELVTVIGQAANTGVRSGSTIGTGIRQLIIDLQSPSEKLQARFRELGIEASKVDLKTQGLIGVMKNLQEAGFTTGDAMENIEVRASAMYAAIAGGVDSMDMMRQQLILSNDAAKANEIQMESLANKWKQFASVFGTLAFTAGQSPLEVLKGLVDGATAAVQAINDLGFAGDILGAVFASIAIGGLLRLTLGLAGLGPLLAVASKRIGALTIATLGLRGGLAAAAIAITGPAGLAAAAVFTALAVLTEGFGYLSGSVKSLQDKLDDASTQVRSTKGDIDTMETAVKSVDDALQGYIDRSDRLRNNQQELQTAILESKQRFGELGLELNAQANSFDDLTAAYRRLRNALSQNLPADYATLARDLGVRQEAERRLAASKVGTAGIGGILDKLDIEPKYNYRKEGNELLGDLGNVATSINIPETLKGKPKVFQDAVGYAAGGGKDPDQYNALIAGLEKYTRESKPKGEEADQISAAVKELRSIRDSLQQIRATGIEIEQVNDKVVESEFRKQNEGNFNRVMQALGTLVNDRIKNEVETTQKFGERAKAATKIKEEVTRGLDKGVETITNGLSDENKSLFFKLYANKIAEFKSDVGKKLGDITNDSVKEAGKALDAEVAALESESQLLRREIDSRRTNGESLKGYKAKLDEVTNKLFAAKTQSVKNDTKGQRPDLVERQVNALQRELDLALQDNKRLFLNKQDQLNSKSERGERSERKESLYEYRPYRERKTYRDDLQEIQNRDGLRRERAQEPINYRKNILAALQNNPERANKGEQFFIEQELRGLEKRQMSQGIKNQEIMLGELKDANERLLKDVADMTAKADLLDKKLKGLDKKGDREGANKIESSRDELLGNADQLKNQQTRIEKEIQTARQELERQRETYRIQGGATGQLPQRDWETASVGTWDAWKQDRGLNDSAQTQAMQDMYSMLTALDGAFQDMFTGILTGTASAKEALKGFFTSILQQATQMAVNRMVMMMFSMIGSAAMGPQGALLTGAGANFQSMGPAGIPAGTPMNFTGRAHGGAVTGGTPNRDSVPTMLMPGEYVMRKSAVDAIGRDKLSTMNASGKTSMNGIMGVMQQTAVEQPDVNVYIVEREQVPGAGPKDIVAVIGQDIERGGAIKRLIQKHAAGRR